MCIELYTAKKIWNDDDKELSSPCREVLESFCPVGDLYYELRILRVKPEDISKYEDGTYSGILRHEYGLHCTNDPEVNFLVNGDQEKRITLPVDDILERLHGGEIHIFVRVFIGKGPLGEESSRSYIHKAGIDELLNKLEAKYITPTMRIEHLEGKDILWSK